KSNFNLTVEIAERKRIEDALKESELKYRSVVENIQEIIFQTDNEGKWLFLNQSWEHVTGFSVEESLGKVFLDFVHPDDRALNLELFEPLIRREKGVCRSETRYLKKDGGYCWIDVFARLGVNDENEVIGTYGSLRDITEQKTAEEFENEMLLLSAQLTGIKLSEIDIALHTTLTRIAKFLNADRSYIFEIHDTGDLMSNTYEWCNDGISAEIDNLKDIPLEVFPEWLKSMQHHRNVIIPSVVDLPAEWINEKEILESQGIKSLIAFPLLYESKFIGFVGLDSVTNYRQYSQSEINVLMVWSSMLSTLIMNKRNESLLEISRQNFKTFFNTIDDFLWVLDENGRIIHINNTVVDRLGYSPEELDAKSVLMVHPENRREEAGKIVTEMLQGKSTF
ncbi:PAS domain S-box protein, partial [bacterium]|nr:PAS domain S-box protein [bacterium]